MDGWVDWLTDVAGRLKKKLILSAVNAPLSRLPKHMLLRKENKAYGPWLPPAPAPLLVNLQGTGKWRGHLVVLVLSIDRARARGDPTSLSLSSLPALPAHHT